MVSVDRATDILWMWRCGYDTFDIARLMLMPESEVVRLLHKAKERAREKVA